MFITFYLAVPARIFSVGSYEMNGFDAVVLVVILASAIFAFSRGFIKELSTWGAFIAAVLVALFFYSMFGGMFRDFISPFWLADTIFMLSVGGLTYVLAAKGFLRFWNKFKYDRGGWLDRVIGAGFGVVRGFVFASLFVLVTMAGYRTMSDNPELQEADLGAYEQSVSVEPTISREILESLPEGVREKMNPNGQETPAIFANSKFFPLLDNIARRIQGLPLSDRTSYAEPIKNGESSSAP